MSKNVKTPILFLAASFLWAGLAVWAPTGVRAPVGQARGVVSASARRVVARIPRRRPDAHPALLPERPRPRGRLRLQAPPLRRRERPLPGRLPWRLGSRRESSADLDGDPATDRLVRLGWIDPSGRWAARLRDVVIARLRFDATAGGVPSVSVVPLSGEVEHRFGPLRLSDLAFVEVPDVLPRSAAAFRGLALAGAGTASTDATTAAMATAAAAATTLPCATPTPRRQRPARRPHRRSPRRPISDGPPRRRPRLRRYRDRRHPHLRCTRHLVPRERRLPSDARRRRQRRARRPDRRRSHSH